MPRRIHHLARAALIATACLASTVCWGSRTELTAPIACPAVAADGSLDLGTTTAATFTYIDVNGKFHGTAAATVTNASGKTHTFHGLTFGFPGATRSTYTVHADGTAKVRMSGRIVVL